MLLCFLLMEEIKGITMKIEQNVTYSIYLPACNSVQRSKLLRKSVITLGVKLLLKSVITRGVS